MRKPVDKDFYKSIIVIALPVILQNLVNSFINILDTVMVGKLGVTSIASVGLGNNIFFFVNIIIFGTVSGAGIFVAQYWGKRELISIRKSVGISLAISLGISFLFMLVIETFPYFVVSLFSKDPAVIAEGMVYLRIACFSYPLMALSMVFGQALRSTEEPKVPMMSSIISLLSNALLNYILIFPLGMGVVGAAIATVVARLIDVAILMVVMYGRKLAPAGTIKEFFSFDRSFLARYLRIVSTVILNETLWSFGITVQNAIFARAGTDAYAAYNITSTISQITWTFVMGVGSAVAVIVGKKIGEGAIDEAYRYANKTCALIPFVGLFFGLFLIPLSYTLRFFFDVDGSILHQAQLMLFVLVCFYPFNAFNMCMIVGVCRSGGDAVYSAVADTLFMYILAIPAAAVAAFVFHASPIVIYLCLMTENLAKAAMVLVRLLSKKWLHDVTVA
ncbi:MAG: MATE family efflux transporter [Treponemataceae bacterium]|nr:MATE family efflux transporter [Treponemataceae bacterium]